MMREDPGASTKRVVSQVKAKIQAEDTAALLAHTTSLPVQALTVREFERHAAQAWPQPSQPYQSDASSSP